MTNRFFSSTYPFTIIRIHTGVEVVEVVSGICVVDRIAEFLAVARAAPWIGVEHHRTRRCHALLSSSNRSP